MNKFSIADTIVTHANAGISREWTFCAHYGIIRTKHDNVAYNKGSDLDIGDKHISIKASKFSLMAGSLCEGKEDFDGIWNVFETNVHSNTFAYITADFIVYEMNINEFKMFVYTFANVTYESEQNGGYAKIQLRKESHKMLKWLDERVA